MSSLIKTASAFAGEIKNPANKNIATADEIKHPFIFGILRDLKHLHTQSRVIAQKTMAICHARVFIKIIKRNV